MLKRAFGRTRCSEGVTAWLGRGNGVARGFSVSSTSNNERRLVISERTSLYDGRFGNAAKEKGARGHATHLHP